MSFFFFLLFLIVIKCQTKEDSSINNSRNLQTTSYQNIELYVDTDCLGGSNSNIDIKTGIERAKKTIEKLIMIPTSSGSIDLRNYNRNIPDGFACSNSLKNGFTVPGDLAIFVKISDNKDIGFGKPTILNRTANGERPYIATIAYNDMLDTIRSIDNSTHKIEAISLIFLHEFTHILGFTKEILQAKNLIKTVSTHYRMNTLTQNRLYATGTNVVNRAKAYFNCQNLTGVELDDDSGDEHMLHWSARILLGDYMIAELYYPDQAISEITLALLEDLGWYKVNYYTGGLMRFGKNKGCQFLEKDCIEENADKGALNSSFPNEFCSKIYTVNTLMDYGLCSSGRQSMSYCLNAYDSKHTAATNFQRSFTYYQGYSNKVLIEFCPFSYDVNLINDANPRIYYGGNCKYGTGIYGKYLSFWGFAEDKLYSKISNIIDDKYSDESFCIFSSLLTNSSNPDYIKGILRPTCYEMSCSELSLTIKIGSEYIVCPREGGTIKIDNDYSKYKGFLICPDYNLICTGSVVCNNIFDCVEKNSTVKNSSFYYNYTPNINVSMEIPYNSQSQINNYINETIYELGEKGTCPKFCQQCTGNGQCTVCADNFTYYIGNKEGDNNTINCTDIKPTVGYYNKTIQGKEYFFKCIENCDICFENNKTICTQCAPTHYINSTDKKCEVRIVGCIDYDKTKTFIDPKNNNASSYYECKNCNNTDKYFCLDMNKTTCEKMPNINKTLYYDMETKNYPCIKKCEDRYMNCESCNIKTCTVCNQTNHFINNLGNCIKEIENCQKHNLSLDIPSCEVCNETNDYYCIDDNRTYCQYISPLNISSYFKKSDNRNACVKLCKEQFGNFCLECNYTNNCTKCQEGYFVYEGNCYKNLTGCIDNKVLTLDPLKLECNECNKMNNYYCINKTRSVCNLMNQTAIKEYYLLPNLSYPCYGLCGELFDNCIECNTTNCFNCRYPNAVNRKKTMCAIPPQYFREDVKCNIIIEDLDNINEDFDFDSFERDYFYRTDHISKVEHFVGKDFTMTLYINSNCTDGLLSKGYYAIDTRELNTTIIDESDYDFNFHLLGFYINHNYRSYLRFYDLEGNEVDLEKDCQTCLEKKYIMTHNLFNILNEVVGAPLAELVIEREINIFNPNNDIYTDRCSNLTLYKIDIPINLRKIYLLLDEYIDPLMCRDIDCELLEYNLKNRTTTCQCKVKNDFNYIFQENDIKYTLSTIREEAKGISEASKAILCMKKGIKYSNFKNNDVAIVILVFFILQFVCYIAYGCFGKPLANISNLPSTMQTLANPPKMEDTFRLYLFADWNLNLSNSTKKDEPIDEEEKVIQPRDDSGDQIMEEEKSFNNDFFSDISIDTNAGGLYPDKRTNRSLRALEKSKKVLILLGNKLKKKMSIEHSLNKEEVISDSDEVPLSKRKKIDNSSFLKNYWLFLSIKQHIINYFSELSCCNITISYIPLELRFVRSIFLFILSIVITILWLDQKYFEKKWEHFNDKYSLSSTLKKDFEISLGERISYALGHNIGNAIVNLIFLIVADFLVGILFFNLRNDVKKIQEKGKMSKMQDYVLKVRRNYNIFYALNFILIVVFFLSLCGFGVEYPGGVADCLTVAIFSVFLLEIVPFVWALILATLRYFGYKKKKKTLVTFSEYFLY